MKKLILLVPDSWASLCTYCNKPNQEGDEFVYCSRLGCRHIVHLKCLNAHKAQHEQNRKDYQQ